MTFMQQLKTFSLLACCLGSLLLVGCNNSNPYNTSDQHVNGSVLQPSTVNPLDPSQPATQVALLINKSVQGLSFTCADVHQSTYITQVLNVNANTSVAGLPVARCGNDAPSATFFLGLKDASGDSQHVDLGTITLPFHTAVGADGKPRYDPSQNNQSSSSFFYPFSIADIENAPARTVADTSTAAGRDMVYKAALLMALDASTSNAVLILADGVNKVAAYPASYGLSCPPNNAPCLTAGFTYSNYAAFKAAWDPYVQAVQQYQVNNSLPSIAGWPAEQTVMDAIGQGASRLQTGNLSLDYSSLTWTYAQLYQNCIFAQLPSFSTNFLVFPDGKITGFGMIQTNALAVSLPGGGCGSIGASGPGDFVFVGPPSSSGSSYSVMDTTQSLQGLQVQSLGTLDGGVSINILGQLLGDFLYDGRSINGSSSDFSIDYPNTNYVMPDSAKGSMTGQLFGVSLPAYADGQVSTPGQVGTGTDPSGGTLPMPIPVRMSRSARIQTAPLDASLLGRLPPFYRIQLMRFCGADESGCASPIPNLAVETGTGGNYLGSYCLAYQMDSNGSPQTDQNGQFICQTTANVTMEIPRVSQQGGSDGNINVKFDTSNAANGVVLMELVDSTCSPLSNTYYLGYVSGTQASGSNLDASVNVSMLFSGSDRASIANGKIPQMGVSLSGRIDLDQSSMPMYRLSDSNFQEKLRARWVDGYKYRLYQATQAGVFGALTNGQPNYTALTLQQKELLNSLYWGSGAVSGQALDSSCTPVP